jgi:hypothetical protein
MALSYDSRIALALAEIRLENKPNCAEYARKHELVLSTLSIRESPNHSCVVVGKSEFDQTSDFDHFFAYQRVGP